ncbi:helix-turn-helix domain-containing protein [Coxiella endosymbiont of Amblyomma sculptum]|uniref:helix-turn-helix domain-containing protein n=1 Tax=Coxiella endosymbiont of Amblyomma sculptum TaxID=2487929 RepID=UPI00132EC711|nr:helix-turn-helix domain-containing protein [Coxiella endosymbiont of Amblyomma sculptum]QHG92520.1 helix-turn-helix domain-containing protein [Coxiella endosymbiont of Amblyomma sculptum]
MWRVATIAGMEIDNNTVHIADKITPGILLREARRAKNLQYEEVAKQVHLSVQWIKNLEKDDYSQAPALIYVRGYLRAYARCVGLEPEEIISVFDSLALHKEFERTKALKTQSVKHREIPIIARSTRMIPASWKTISWVTLLTLVVLITIVGVCWQGKKHPISEMNSINTGGDTIEPKFTKDRPETETNTVFNTDNGK